MQSSFHAAALGISAALLIPRALGFLCIDPSTSDNELTDESEVIQIVDWLPNQSFEEHAECMIAGVCEQYNKPMIFRNTAVMNWPAINWTWEALSAKLQGAELESVKFGGGDVFYWYDKNASGEEASFLPSHDLGFKVQNLSAAEVLDAIIHQDKASLGYQYLGKVPELLVPDMSPDDFLYLNDESKDLKWQKVWLSTAGSRTPLHFDNDANMFVQLLGTKVFTFFPPAAHDKMCPYPRFHPMWHKSRMDFEQPCIHLCPQYKDVQATTVRVSEGDVLFLPGFWWHHVLSETASFSLTTYSAWTDLYKELNSIYRMPLTHEKLILKQSKQYAMRWFLVSLLLSFGGEQTLETVHIFVHRLLQSRYRGLESSFDMDESEDPWICVDRINKQTPTTNWVQDDIRTDVLLITGHFQRMPEAVRGLLLDDYIEQIVNATVGPKKVLSYFRHCALSEAGFLEEDESIWECSEEHKSTCDQ